MRNWRADCSTRAGGTAGDDSPTPTLIRQVLGAVAQFEKTVLVLKALGRPRAQATP